MPVTSNKNWVLEIDRNHWHKSYLTIHQTA